MSGFEEEKIPHSLTLEQSVLTGAMFDGTGWDEISDILAEDDFFSAPHRYIFRAIKTMYGTNQAVDAELVHQWLLLNSDMDCEVPQYFEVSKGHKEQLEPKTSECGPITD